jgi:hypothetical protein
MPTPKAELQPQHQAPTTASHLRHEVPVPSGMPSASSWRNRADEDAATARKLEQEERDAARARKEAEERDAELARELDRVLNS